MRMSELMPLNSHAALSGGLRRPTDVASEPVAAGVFLLEDVTASGDFAPRDRNFRTIKLPNARDFFDDGRESTGKAFRRRKAE